MPAKSFARRPPCSGLAALLAAALWLSAAAALAQEAPTPAPEVAPQPIQAIALEQIGEEAERLAGELDSRLPSDEAREALRQTAAELEDSARELGERLERVRLALEAAPNVRILRELELQVAALLKPLEERGLTLDRETGEVTQALEQTERSAAVWKETQAAARSAGASAAALQRIASTRRELEKTQQELVAWRNELLTLRDRLGKQKAAIDEVAQQVRSAIRQRLEGIFSIDQSPIWSGDVRRQLAAELRPGWTEPVAGRLRVVVEYVRDNAQILGFQLALFLGLVAGLRAMDTRVRARADAEQLRDAAEVFSLPVSMAFVITLAFTPQLHPLAPRLFVLLIGTVAVVPAVLIVRRITPDVMSPLVFGLLVFFVTDRVRAILETVPTLERLILQVELIGAIGFLAWLIRPSRMGRVPAEMIHERAFRVAGVAIRIAMALLALALVADIAGMGDLAELVADGTLRGAYAGLFAYALFKVLQSLLAYAVLGYPLRLLRLVSRHRQLVRRRVDRALRVLVALLWAYATLTFFGIGGVVASGLGSMFGAELSVGAVSISLGDVAAFIVTAWLTFKLARLVDFVLKEDVYPRVRLARGVPYAVSSLVRYTLLFFGFLLALAAGGIELSKLVVVAGGLGVGIGFGLQSVVNNFVSGLILLFERPFKVGDAIQIGEMWGEIRRIGIRASVIRTWDGAEVVVPNGALLAEPVTNWTLSDRKRRVEVNVGVEYGTDAQRVIELLLEVARGQPSVLGDPEPVAYFVKFGDSALEFLLRCWIAEFGEGFLVRSALSVAIQRALREAGISVPFPQRDLHLRTVSPEASSALGEGGDPASAGPRSGAGKKGAGV